MSYLAGQRNTEQWEGPQSLCSDVIRLYGEENFYSHVFKT